MSDNLILTRSLVMVFITFQIEDFNWRLVRYGRTGFVKSCTRHYSLRNFFCNGCLNILFGCHLTTSKNCVSCILRFLEYMLIITQYSWKAGNNSDYEIGTEPGKFLDIIISDWVKRWCAVDICKECAQNEKNLNSCYPLP